MAIYYTFFESLLYIWKTVINYIESVIKPVVYSKQGRMYNKMYSKMGSLYITKFFTSKSLQQKCIECIVKARRVSIYVKKLFRKV